MSEPQAAPALGPDDYHALLGMLTSEDASARAQGQALAKKLTPSEQQTFFDVQQQANKGKGELTRGDNQVALGVPPELAVTGGIGAVRSIAGAIAGSAPGVASRVAAGTKAAIAQAAPTLKYEATKTALEKMGVPTAMAVPIAMAVSGYKPGAKAAPAETIPAEAMPAAAAPASPGAAGPVAPAPPAAAAASASAPSAIAAAPPEAPPAAPAGPGPAAAKPRLTGLSLAEFGELQRLSKQGKTLKEALDAIQAQRAFQARFGLTTPTPEQTMFPKGMRGKAPE